MKILYIDPVGGLSGDMLLGALADLGWPLDSLRAELQSLGLDNVRIHEESRTHQGISSRGVVVSSTEKDVHRRLPEIEQILCASDPASPPHRKKALEVFRLLVGAEGKIHGLPPEEVHLHEVGALDAIVDIVGACLALEDLGVSRVHAGSFPLGTGTTTSAHGTIPLPAPATLEILRGALVRWTGEEGEKVTPTGAALAMTLTDDYGPPPPLTVEAVGWGGGSRPTPETGRPNVVRLILGKTAPEQEATEMTRETVAVLTCNIDDMTPEEMGHLQDRLMEEGALDFYVAHGIMKKGRPGWRLEVLCVPEAEERLRDLILSESTTLGLRSRLEGRWVLPRKSGELKTPLGTVEVKWIRRGTEWVAEPEFESLRRVARAVGVPPRRVAEEVLRAAREQGSKNPHSRG
jgi:uncharacterized protein (TIGR00299 family) protein